MNEINIQLSEQELKWILESLVFSASVDVNAEWGLDEILDIKNLSIKIRKQFPKILTENISVFTDLKYHDLHTEELLTEFPELQKTLNL